MRCSHLSLEQSNNLYKQVIEAKDYRAMKQLCLDDLFFLILVGLNRKDINRQWLYERCREVESSPNEHLDLWAREHYKSTIITFALTIQDILKNPEEVIGIFSHTRPIAKAFLKQIKVEFEDNRFLKSLFPEILYANPKSEAPNWSLDSGITVKRKSNPKECTVEAWGLVDGQPTSKHFSKLVYDDVVTKESVSTPEQIKKVTESLALSYNLGARGGHRRFIGTRYHYNDTYKVIISRGTVNVRLHPATKNGKINGEPVFLTRKELDTKRQDFGSYVYACQMLQDPKEDSAMGFKVEWLMYYDRLVNHYNWNFYLLVDPAGKKKKENDYTVMVVIGLAPDGNYYLVDGIRDRLNLTEKAKKLFQLHRKWRPVRTGYEEYGMQADIEHMEYEMGIQNYRFKIIPLGGNKLSKEDRIRKLVPIFENHRFYLPHKLLFKDYEGNVKDFVLQLLEDEYEAFPVGVHDDMMDCMARIVDPSLGIQFPEMRYNNNSNGQAPSVTQESGHDKVKTDYDVLAC